MMLATNVQGGRRARVASERWLALSRDPAIDERGLSSRFEAYSVL